MWSGLYKVSCSTACASVRIKAIDCSYLQMCVKERFCHGPPTLRFERRAMTVGLCSILEADRGFLGRFCNCYRGWAERPANKWPFAAGWIGSLLRWQSSVIVEESFFFYEHIKYSISENHLKGYWYLTEWNGDLSDQQLVIFPPGFRLPIQWNAVTFISWSPSLRSVDLF